MDSRAQAERLTALRDELARRGLDAFLVPRSDQHQGEYVPPEDERLAWLTGFTGSAGMAVVTTHRAAIFTDGRYTIQVRQQTDGTLYEYRHLTEQPPERWLAEVLEGTGTGSVLGFDPWLHTLDGVARLRGAVEAAGATLVAVDSSPLDAVWTDRPLPQTNPAEVQPFDYTGEAVAQKLARIAGVLRDAKQDAVVLSAPESLCWLLNLRGTDLPFTPFLLGYVIVHADGLIDLFVDPAKITGDVRAHLARDARVNFHAPAAFLPALDRLAGKVVRLDRQSAAWAIADRLARAGAVAVQADDPCAIPRACKNAVELDGARAAHRRDAVGMIRFLSWLDAAVAAGEPLTELSVSDRLEAIRKEIPLYRDQSFATISGAGEHGAICHYRATEESNIPLSSGPVYLIDSGGQYGDGTTDITRTIAVGPVTAEQRRRYTQVLKGHIALSVVRFPEGTTGSQLDVLARQFLWADGVDYDHGTGHGVGSYLSVHEGPQRISKAPNTVALRPGMILSNEPGYYKDGEYGIRIENLQAVRPVKPQPDGAERTMLGFETLTLVPIDKRLIETSLLTAEERDWLNAYHLRVAQEIGPHVPAEAQDWLKQATAPL